MFKQSRLNLEAEAKFFQALQSTLTQANSETAQKARRLCPVDTGALRGSIRVPRPLHEGDEIKSAIEAGSDLIDYAYKVEMLYSPFLRPVHYDIWSEFKRLSK